MATGRFQTPADVHVKLIMPPGPGDQMSMSVTPHKAHVQPPGNGSVITWQLTGLPGPIDGLEFPESPAGIQITDPAWVWGNPQRDPDDPTVYTLVVNGDPTLGQPFKYTVRIQWNGGSAQIDPEIEFDPPIG